MVKAVTEFLEHVAALLRQVVHVVGWLVLLIGVIKLLVYQNPSPEHFVLPGAGALAVLQSLIRPRRTHNVARAIEDVTSQLATDLPPAEDSTETEAETPVSQHVHR